ncbi:hypothetical protein ACQZV8_11205 [Magnetococcales bacterium HHB-1]
MDLRVNVPDDLNEAIKDLPKAEVDQAVAEALQDVVATHQQGQQQIKSKKNLKWEKAPAFGIWADNPDVEDVDAYVRKIRDPRTHVD